MVPKILRSFMYIIGGLIIAKLMQNRYPYFNANSFCAFWGFSVVTLFIVIGLVSFHLCFPVPSAYLTCVLDV